MIFILNRHAMFDASWICYCRLCTGCIKRTHCLKSDLASRSWVGSPSTNKPGFFPRTMKP